MLTNPVTGSPETEGLAAPEDDGAADHLPGRRVAPIRLAATDGRRLGLHELAGRTVVFVHPAIGGPTEAGLVEEWKAIPGAFGCTSQACAVRDEMSGFQSAGARVLGLSSQSSAAQRDAVERLRLAYPLLSDQALRLADAMRLPTFEFHGERYLRRLTLVIADGAVEAALYPVFPPDAAAGQALRWLARKPLRR